MTRPSRYAASAACVESRRAFRRVVLDRIEREYGAEVRDRAERELASLDERDVVATALDLGVRPRRFAPGEAVETVRVWAAERGLVVGSRDPAVDPV